MKNRAKIIINRLLIAATISLVNGHEAKGEPILDVNEPESDSHSRINSLQEKIKTQLFKLTKFGKVYLVNSHTSHGSHSSHSSHASHSSHYSSSVGNSGKGNSSSQNSSSRDAYSVGINNGASDKQSQFAPINSTKDAGLFNFGDRILRKDIYGEDVKQLTDYLIDINLITNEQIIYQNEFVLFDENIERAVKILQDKLGLQPTGVIDTECAKVIQSQMNKYKSEKENK